MLTADLCDEGREGVRLVEDIFKSYGQLARFQGPALTLAVFEDNKLVADILETPGEGRVLVIDGGGSRRHALVGGRLAGLVHSNGWAGVLVYGSIRDSAEMAELPVAVRALGTCPVPPAKRGEGRRDVELRFAGVTIAPGEWIVADEDGILVSSSPVE
jgi:regulator of ribonuclease activity A